MINARAKKSDIKSEYSIEIMSTDKHYDISISFVKKIPEEAKLKKIILHFAKNLYLVVVLITNNIIKE